MYVIMKNNIPVCVSKSEDTAFMTAMDLIKSEFCGNIKEKGLDMLFNSCSCNPEHYGSLNVIVIHVDEI